MLQGSGGYSDNRLGAAPARLGRLGAAALVHRPDRFHAFDLHPEMAESGRRVLVRPRQLDERALAHAQVDQKGLIGVIRDAKRFLVAHRFGVEGDGFLHVRNRDAHVIELNDARVHLGDGRLNKERDERAAGEDG